MDENKENQGEGSVLTDSSAGQVGGYASERFGLLM